MAFKLIDVHFWKRFIKSCTPNLNKWGSYSCSFSNSNNLFDKMHLFPNLEESYFCDPNNKAEIAKNIKIRKGIGDIEKVLQIYSEIDSDNDVRKELLVREMLKIPNRTHPKIVDYGETPQIEKYIGVKRSFDCKATEFHNLAKSLKLLRNDLSNFTGQRSYFFTSRLAELESALVQHTLSRLLTAGFQLVSVPDILPRSTIECSGMETRGKRSQVSLVNFSLHLVSQLQCYRYPPAIDTIYIYENIGLRY